MYRKKNRENQAEKTGYVDATAVFIDSTHIKASANKHKSKEVKVQVALIFSCLNLKKLAKRKLLNFIFFFCPRSY